MPPRQPVPTQFNTAEFRRSDGPAEHNAATAWASGHTGRGVTIAIVDTGVDPDNPEFTGRISPLSKDVLNAGRDIAGSDDHGTHVALVAAAARNGIGVVGIALDATILALRTDAVGSCGADSPQDTNADCSFSDRAISDAIDYASSNGAKVINVSLGGEGASSQLRSAVAAASNRGSLVVVSAGNDGAAAPDNLATQLAAAANGGAIIVGSVDGNGQLSEFSNRAGDQNSYFMTALGERICCSYENGQLYTDKDGFVYLFSGTSFAAPQVSGAAALLAQAFPNLSGKEIADILLRTAYDVGAPGPDPIYGRGILDIARAFQPIGTTSLAGSATALSLSDVTAIGSPAMGDALSRNSLRAIVLDEYGRAFSAELAGTLRGAPPLERLSRALSTEQRSLSLSSKALSVTLVTDAYPSAETLFNALSFDQRISRSSRVLAGRLVMHLNDGSQLGLGYAQSSQSFVNELQRAFGPAFLIAPSVNDGGVSGRSNLSMALRQRLGPWGLTLSAEKGNQRSSADALRLPASFGNAKESKVSTYGFAMDRRFGRLDTSLALSWLGENRTMLGGQLHDAFSLGGADTLFVEARTGWNPAPGWRLQSAMRHGQTWARDGELTVGSSSIVSTAWSLDLTRSQIFSVEDSLGFRLSQPLRIGRGSLNLLLPLSYDYDTLTPQYVVQSLELAPHGREFIAELSWQGPLFTGWSALAVFYRTDPGHYEAAADDKGVAVVWSKLF